MNQLQEDIKKILLYIKRRNFPDGIMEDELRAYKRLERYCNMDLSYDGGIGLFNDDPKNTVKK